MADLEAARDTRKMISPYDMCHEMVGATSTTVYEGGMVMLNSSGLIAKAAAGGKAVVGRCSETVVSNTAGSRIKFESGIFNYVNGGASVTAAMRGSLCYVADDQTVNATDTGTPAGIVYELESTTGVWVLMTPLTYLLAQGLILPEGA
jgi:hypothetical protein